MATGTIYSYTDTGVNKRAISDAVYMIDWVEAPLLNILGFGMSNKNKFDLVNWPSTKAELIEDTMPIWYSTTAEAVDTTETDIDVTDGTLFRTGDIVATYDNLDTDFSTPIEKMYVSSVSSNTITVVRAWGGYGGTYGVSGTAADSGDLIRVETRAMGENAANTTGYSTTTTQPYNYTQIISQAVEVSRTELKMSEYGIDDMLDYKVGKLFADNGSAGDLAKKLANTFYTGERVQRTSSVVGSMGGFKVFVTTSTASANHVFDLSSAAIQRTDIHKVIRAIRSAGGKATHLLTGAWGMEKVEEMYEGNRTYTQDTTLGGSEILKIRTPHGQVKVAYDYMCPEDHYFFFDQNKAGWVPFDEFQRESIKSTELQKDGYQANVVGEYTFMLANAKSHGYIYGASVTS